MTNVDARLVYENAKLALRKAFPDVPNIAEICKLTQSTLRLEQPMKVGNSSYTFPVLVNENKFSDTESRLLQQDSAIISQIGVFVAVPGTSTDTNYPLSTFPDELLFSTGTTKDDLFSLYNGNLSIAVNNDILLPNWDLFKHLNIPETQSNSVATVSVPNVQSEIRGSFDGFYPVEPNLVWVGSKNNVVKITVPGGLNSVEANSRIVIIARAIIAQNSTVVS